jgi:hypothetical protein
MTFNPDDPAPPNREYPVRDEGIRNGGAFGIIIVMVAIAIVGYYWLDNRPVTPDQVETTGSAPASVLPQSPPLTLGRD